MKLTTVKFLGVYTATREQFRANGESKGTPMVTDVNNLLFVGLNSRGPGPGHRHARVAVAGVVPRYSICRRTVWTYFVFQTRTTSKKM